MAYNGLRRMKERFQEYYQAYRGDYDIPKKEHNKIGAFFKALLAYIFRLQKPTLLSQEQRQEFESGLGNLASQHHIEYRPGSITLKPKNLADKI